MGDLSLPFHVFSLLVFIILGYFWLRVRADLKLWRDWNSGALGQRVVVGEPLRVLKRFAGAIGADFSSELPDHFIPVSRVRLDSCFNLHRTQKILKIMIKNAERCRVDFVLDHGEGILGDDLAKIKLELGGKVDVAVMKPE